MRPPSLLRGRAPSARRVGRSTVRSPLPTPRATARLRATPSRPPARWTSLGQQRGVDRDPDPRHRLASEVVAAVPRLAVAGQPAQRQPEDRVASLPIGSELDRARVEPARRQHHPARRVYVVVAAGVRAYRRHAVALALDLDDDVRRSPAGRRRSAAPRAARRRRGSRMPTAAASGSRTRPCPSRLSSSDHAPCGSRSPRIAGKPTRSSACSSGSSCAAKAARNL